jgi:hypothetical protein
MRIVSARLLWSFAMELGEGVVEWNKCKIYITGCILLSYYLVNSDASFNIWIESISSAFSQRNIIIPGASLAYLITAETTVR